MTKAKALMILDMLEGYEKLERKNVTEAGWIALKFSTTERQAEVMITQARKFKP